MIHYVEVRGDGPPSSTLADLNLRVAIRMSVNGYRTRLQWKSNDGVRRGVVCAGGFSPREGRWRSTS